VDLPADVARGFYHEYASRALWPALHGFSSRVSVPAGSWWRYLEANRRFCRLAAAHVQAGDSIWVHDYHLMPLPRLLRQARPEARVGFFLHTPFPEPEAFRLIPHHEPLLRGVLGADAVGFQTEADRDRFRRTVREILGARTGADAVMLSGRTVHMEAAGAGIDAAALVGRIQSDAIRSAVSRLRRSLAGRRLVLAVDRLDYTKGIPARLRAFRALLAATPALRGKVVLVQVAAPTRNGVAGYDQLARQVVDLVGRINAGFARPGWKPVTLVHRSLPPEELGVLYRAADVAWVSPLRDGMNLVAKEYVACQADGAGVLILSRFAGAAASLREALIVNPYDEDASAAALAAALRQTPAESRVRMSRMLRRVVTEDAEWWRERCLAALDAAVRARGQRAAATGRPAALALAGPAATSVSHRASAGS
jgi:alpha,alpha-trehalose-phosphate synthase [UDP-forming]